LKVHFLLLISQTHRFLIVPLLPSVIDKFESIVVIKIIIKLQLANNY